jgi:hypothetical protein
VSEENVEIVRRLYAAMNLSVPGAVNEAGGPPESAMRFSDPEIEWQGPREALKNGRAIRIQSYWERADALKAVGLSE